MGSFCKKCMSHLLQEVTERTRLLVDPPAGLGSLESPHHPFLSLERIFCPVPTVGAVFQNTVMRGQWVAGPSGGTRDWTQVRPPIKFDVSMCGGLLVLQPPTASRVCEFPFLWDPPPASLDRLLSSDSPVLCVGISQIMNRHHPPASGILIQ